MTIKSTISENAMDLLRKRYFQPGEEIWEELVERVAFSVAMAEPDAEAQKHWRQIFQQMITDLEFIPSSPCLMNAVPDGTGQLSSCFIISLKDTIESIYEANGECAKIFQRNGGVGMNISVLRPEDAIVETAKGKSCGTIGFMEVFDLTADIVTRNNPRKGAIKIDLNDWHPDIERFIACKKNGDEFSRMNISVSISDKFMNAVLNDKPWDLKFPDYSSSKEIYDAEWDGNIEKWEQKGLPVKTYKTVSAKKLYSDIMYQAWSTGEPGVSFRDHMDRDNPNPHLGSIDSTNPCSEFTSIPYNSCNLGSINLLSCCTEYHSFDFDKFETIVKHSVQFLDDMITVNELPLPAIDEITKKTRSVGLGVMGFADALYQLKIPYNSEEAYDFTAELFSMMRSVASEKSNRLAFEKGCYPAFKGSVWDEMFDYAMRNSNLISIAPTGSISFLAGVSGGIEPNFGLVFTRRTNEGDIYHVVNPIFKEVLEREGLYNEEILQKIADNNGSCQGLPEIPKEIKEIFLTTMDILPTDHTKMVGHIQQFVDLSISKTVNVPSRATVEDMENVYIDAWQQGIKGITVYRDGSRSDQTLASKREEEAKKLDRGDWAPIAEDTIYIKRKIYIGCGKITLFIGWSPSKEKIQEFWVKRSGSGGCERNLENMTIAMSGMMRLGGNILNIDRAFEGVGGCNAFTAARGKGSTVSKGNNCGNAVLFEIKKFLAEQKPEAIKTFEHIAPQEITEQVPEEEKKPCPECGEELINTSGCINCRACGYSKC